MSQEPQNQPKDEIEPLSDESLEEVSGGVCSWSSCSNQN
jgi:hypothetical protein